MSAATNYLEGKLVDLVLRGIAWSTPAPLYGSLFKADPTDDPAGAAPTGENTDANYLRVNTGATPSSAWPAVTGGLGNTKNANVLTFAAIVTAQITITHWVLFDGPGASAPPLATEGNPILRGALTASKVLDISDVASFPANSFSITVA